MFSRIFPKVFDNTFRGNRFALWLLVPIVLLKLVIGTNSILNTRDVAITADAIPLDSFGAQAAGYVILLFALAGLSNLLMGLQGVVVLVRYRAMIPLMYLLLLVQQLGGRAISFLHPAAGSGIPSAQIGSAVILSILAATVIGFVLSLLKPRDAS